MLTRLSLRIRIFLFFCLLAVGAAALAGAALAFGWSRAEAPLPVGPFATAFVVFAFLNTGLALGVWLLFDEHVAKPINQLSADLRLRAHARVDKGMGAQTARYLGDLAPAATALSETLNSSVMETAAQVAHETRRLRAEADRLTALLTQMPIATILLNPSHEIVLYDAQAADVLSRIAAPRLKAPLSDYFDLGGFAVALLRLRDNAAEVPFKLRDVQNGTELDARVKALGDDGHMIFIDVETPADRTIAPRPLVFDFDLMNANASAEVEDTRLSDLCLVVFDTETTGLSVEKDDIVQLGAVRMVNGRIVEGERIDTYVNPGRPIPPASTRIHHVTDAHVADAPDIAKVGRDFHLFARDAVLVAHNAPFDIGLIRRHTAGLGLEWTNPVLDTVLLSAVAFGTTEEHSLDALCERLSIDIPADLRHTALGDAVATAKAAGVLLSLLEGRGIRTLGALLQETRRHGRLLRDLNA